ncbi:hypothetical protein BB559_006987 [Furculomyces boomerangus]|uniref:Vacuolar protein sorting-associated protein 27 n=2 Tax=Harpellales TaxID=61421 RepID=A0A2T9XZG8_9FUNG|nr:hypothetical protein BB559_006987 [Furculomyces boomerangus]PWA01249.1 hypothetical protein BB558_002664 [Smittium angustum]
MVTRLFFGSPIEDELASITSENTLGNEIDYSLALEYADKVKSKTYSAKEVSKYLQKRLEIKNPNVQMKVVKLADVLVKNSGKLFLLEISRKEFIDKLVFILDSNTEKSVELKDEILKCLFGWSIAFKNDPELAYAVEAYERLKRQGRGYKKATEIITPAVIETSEPPEWIDSNTCMRCRTPFTFSNRKHHCRRCGKCYCNDCSNNYIPIPNFGIYEDVRVCNSCYLMAKNVTRNFSSLDISKGDDTKPKQPKVKSVEPTISKEDEDLKKAIELSLKETKIVDKPPVYVSPSSYDEREEIDLKTAIEASLRESTPYSSTVNQSHTQRDQSHPFSNNVDGFGYPQFNDPYIYSDANADKHGYNNNDDSVAPVNENEPDTVDDDQSLTNTEMEDINLFKSLLEQIQSQGRDIRNSQQTQYLYESVGEIRPKIQSAINNVDEKYQKLLRLHERIMTAVKIYDQLLDNHLSGSKPIVYEANPTSVPNNLASNQIVPETSPSQHGIQTNIPNQNQGMNPRQGPDYYYNPVDVNAPQNQNRNYPSYISQSPAQSTYGAFQDPNAPVHNAGQGMYQNQPLKHQVLPNSYDYYQPPPVNNEPIVGHSQDTRFQMASAPAPPNLEHSHSFGNQDYVRNQQYGSNMQNAGVPSESFSPSVPVDYYRSQPQMQNMSNLQSYGQPQHPQQAGFVNVIQPTKSNVQVEEQAKEVPEGDLIEL